MKVLIAYDGSESADTAIDGLRRAGLPIQADALVVSMAEVWLPTPEHEASFKDSFLSEIPGLDRARARAAERMSLANETAQSACRRISQIFPQWQFRYQALSGSAAHEILNLVRQWEPDLSAILMDKSVTVSSVVVTGVPKQALVAHAEVFGADCIFTGATGLRNPI
jgi:nucleotide-binding universal stress UspA family protein